VQRRNRYYRRSRISEYRFRLLVRYFALDLSAADVAELTGLTHKTVNTIFLNIRRRLAEDCARQSPFAGGEVEADESYFGARRVRGKRGRGASGKTIVFGLLKRDEYVYTEIVPDCKKRLLYSPLFVVASRPKRSSIRMVGAAMIDWLMSATRNTSESRTGRMSLLGARHTSTALRASGVLPSAGFRSSMAYRLTLSICI